MEVQKMEITSISRLKASLSHFLKIIRTGEEVIITDRGKAFAKIVPLEKEDAKTPPHLQELERAGLVHIGSGKIPREFWQHPRAEDAEGLALRALLEEREESR